MVQSTATYPNIIRSLDKLNILVFWEILKSKNPYLLEGDYMEDKQYTEEEKQYIYQTWEIMYDSYFQLKKDGKSKLVLQQSYDLMLLAYKINNLEYIARTLQSLEDVKDILPEDDYLNHKQGLLSLIPKHEPDLTPKYFESIADNVELLGKMILALQNKYNRAKKDNDKEVSEQVENVYSVIVKVEKIIDRQITAEATSVMKWLAYEKQANDITKAKEEEYRRKKRK